MRCAASVVVGRVHAVAGCSFDALEEPGQRVDLGIRKYVKDRPVEHGM